MIKKHPTQPLVWLITGTSQGFGRELVRVALERGDRVIATSRTPEKVSSEFPEYSDRLLATSMDLTNPSNISTVIEKAISRFGKIDVLINNAGHGLLGAIEEGSAAEIAKVYETNVFGLIRVIQAVLPQMRKQRHGHIVNLSSIAGLTGMAGWGFYNSTKFAVEGISEALALEIAPLGIHVTIVEPGPFRTDFLGSSLTYTSKSISDYAPTAGKTREYAEERHGKQVGDPVLAAIAIVDAVLSDNPPLHLLLGEFAYEKAQNKLDELRREFENWKEVSLSTDYRSYV